MTGEIELFGLTNRALIPAFIRNHQVPNKLVVER